MQPSPQPHSIDVAPEAEPHEPQDWLEDLDQLPPRPRRRLLAPAPLALLAVLLVACGFIAGVLIEKGQNGGSSAGSATSALASRLGAAGGAAARTAGGAGAAGSASATGTGPFAGRSAGSAPTSGTVSYSANGTLYVTDGESHTVKVKTSAATTVTKTVTSSVHAIHPGETVTVTGKTEANGTVSAEAIRIGGSPFGGGGGSAAATGGPALFGGG
jgi:hypothetical protein